MSVQLPGKSLENDILFVRSAFFAYDWYFYESGIRNDPGRIAGLFKTLLTGSTVSVLLSAILGKAGIVLVLLASKTGLHGAGIVGMVGLFGKFILESVSTLIPLVVRFRIDVQGSIFRRFPVQHPRSHLVQG